MAGADWHYLPILHSLAHSHHNMAIVISQVYRGDTWQRAWVVSDSPNYFQNATARLHVRDETRSLIMSASTADGRLTISPDYSRVDLVMPKEVMAIPPKEYDFDLEVTWANGVRLTIDKSVLVILEDVTYA